MEDCLVYLTAYKDSPAVEDFVADLQLATTSLSVFLLNVSILLGQIFAFYTC